MTYLTRPVFEFPIDWSDPVNQSVDFDLRKLSLGFGAEIFLPLQTHVIKGYDVALVLDGSAEIAACNEFFHALTGRLQGFWFPAPFVALRIVGAVSATQFDIADQGLRDTLADHPDVYLYFEARAGVAARCAKINAVALQAAGIERVTLAAALATPVTLADTAMRLHYVRLASDIERARFYGEGLQRRELRVIELPHEYEAYETGDLPLYLYHFWTAEPMNWHWRFTSFAANVVSGNQLFTQSALTHGALTKSIRLENEGVDIEAAFDVNHPLALFLPIPFSRSLHLEILEASFADPDTTRTLFVGRVRTVVDEGEKLVARCDSWAGVLARKFPGAIIGPTCNWQVFDRNCGLERWKKETIGDVVSVDNTVYPPTLTLQLIAGSTQEDDWMTTDWFAGGWIETGNGVGFQVRTILASTGDAPETQVTLTLNHGVTVEVGQRVHLVPGCNGSVAHCRDKFGNFPNGFGGFPAVPERNLSLQAVEATASAGGKK
jgi:uncharacterized phage protein (TIGR02218 family)